MMVFLQARAALSSAARPYIVPHWRSLCPLGPLTSGSKGPTNLLFGLEILGKGDLGRAANAQLFESPCP